MATKSEAERLTDAAVKLSNNIQNNYFDLGEILYELKEHDYYKLIDGNKYYSDEHKLWKQFCEDKLPVGYRTAQYWLNIYRYFTDMGVEKERLQEAGWSKIKELVDLTENTNVLEQGLEIAHTGTIQDVKAFVATIKSEEVRLGEDIRETLKSKKFNFQYFEAAAETVEQILNEAAKDTEGNQNDALFKIMIEWYQSRQVVDEDVLSYEEEETERLIEVV